MLVYRFLSEGELRCILANRVDLLGRKFNSNDKLSNNHRYKYDKKYLHFFKNKSAIKYIRLYHTKDNYKHYVCTFDIPYLTLLKGIGKGRYETGGMDYLITTEREYIIPTDEFKCEWLKSYVSEQEYLEEMQHQK